MSSTIHRFTPPTCTLEISGKKSSLSRWTNSDVLKKFQFQLRFDDPRQPTARQVTIRGNQQEFLKLQTAINDYLQTQLQSSFRSAVTTEIPPTREVDPQIPYLKPQGLVHHELFFGSLTHDCDRPQIKLSTVQLFDLVTALEAYQREITALPDISATRSKAKILPLWGGIAAAAIAAISLTTVFKPQTQPEVASSNHPVKSPIRIPELDQILTPSARKSNQQPTATPQLKDPLSSTKRLPPPPAVDTPKPKPDIPDPAEYPLSDVARQSGLDESRQKDTASDPVTKSTVSESEPTQSETVILEETPIKIISPQPEVTPQNPTQIEKNLNSELDILNESSNEPEQDLAAKSSSNISTSITPLQQVSAYFESKWQPPADLQQGLEYRLLLDPNGSITRVIPLGKASRLYLSQTNIPVNGKPFISPLAEAQPLRIRLLLNPDGRVQVFQESN